METKRFIGNDMTRIYARVRRDFGPDAIIVQTRSLLREGADPLIEVLAAPGQDGYGLPLDLQQAMIDGSLARAEGVERQLTVGDLEDLVERERASRHIHSAAATATLSAPSAQIHATAESVPASVSVPEWVEPVSAFSLSTVAPVEDVTEALPAPNPRSFPSLPQSPVEAPPSADWATRPRPAIVTRPRRPEAAPLPEMPAARTTPFTVERPSRRSLAPFAAAGLSERAARILADLAPELEPESALAALLERREVHYPDERHSAIITMQGLAGAGRTTALMRMALDCADSGRHTVLLAADGSHVGGRDQVHAYAEAIGLTAYDAFDAGDVVRAAGQAPRGSCIFVDVPAGQWQPPAIPGVAHFAYIAVPAHWQSEALQRALHEYDLGAFAGAVLTFTDLAPSLSPAVSQVVESPLGVAFISSSRDVGTGIGLADPGAMASGIFTTSTGESTDGRVAATA